MRISYEDSFAYTVIDLIEKSESETLEALTTEDIIILRDYAIEVYRNGWHSAKKLLKLK